MHSHCRKVLHFFASALLLTHANSAADAQATPTASRSVDLSAYLGIAGDLTGLRGGRNTAVQAGLTASHPIHTFLPGFEVRGRYTLVKGQVVKQRELEGGLRVKKPLGIWGPYVDVLLGTGDALYLHGGYPIPQQGLLYLETSQFVLSRGFGAEVEVSRSTALVFDGQFERWSLPFSPSGGSEPGALYSKVATLGIVYRLFR